MTVQLPLPGVWPRNMSRRDPAEALTEIRRDRLEAKYRLRLVLDEFADKHGISPVEVNKLVYGYVDDMLTDLFFDKEEEIRAEAEAEIARERQ